MRQLPGGHCLVVVDNGEDRRARETVGRFGASHPSVRVNLAFSAPGNKSAALNAGIAETRTEWVAFTDDDTLPTPEWLSAAHGFLLAGTCRAFGGRVAPGVADGPLPKWLSPGRSGRLPGGGAVVSYDPMDRSGILPGTARVPYGANFFVRRDVFADHGGYDEDLWDLCGRAALGVDDGEFGVRLQKRGEPIGYCREAAVTHPVYSDRFSLTAHWRTAWRYGWRDPFVFLNPSMAIFPLFQWKTLAALQGRFVADLFRRDFAGAVDDVLKIAVILGRVAGRRSPSYRKWASMRAAETGQKEDGARIS
jgi:GT2 family glycosyltransferase